ncbi:MAG: ABC transporter permease, partial [Planktomarina sp.]|nr:ABC transporter permease [Planktomarina sp.]
MAALTVISRKPLSFVLLSMGLLGAVFGILMGMSMGNAGLGIVIGIITSVGFSYFSVLGAAKEKLVRFSLVFLALVAGYFSFGLAGMIAGGLWGWFYGWFVFWLFEGRYR